MESSGEKFDRLLKALDALVSEEAAAIAEADYPSSRELQERAQPLIDALAKLAPSIRSTAARSRLEDLVKRRRRSIELLEVRMDAARVELDTLRKSTQSAARIVPSYGRAARSPAPNRLRVSG